MQSGYLVQAYEKHTWRVLFSLPACISIVMLLIDYVVHGETTPTTWPAMVLPCLSAQALNDLEAMHAILAHGSVLRGFFLEQISSDMPEQRDWSALYAWLARLSDAEIERLVTYGIRSNLESCRMYPQTPQTPEMGPLLEQLEADDAVLEDELYRSKAIRAILDSWGVQQHGPSLALIEHPERLRAAISGFLQELWQKGFCEQWERRKDGLAATVSAIQTWLAKDASTSLPDEVVFRVTGLQLTEEWVPVLQRASSVVFVPCLFLGRYLSLMPEQDTLYIFYEPLSAPDYPEKEGVQEKPAASSRVAESKQAYSTAFQVLDLGTLGPTIRTLGDTTSLTILMALAEHGEMFAQQVAEKLNVHQSTTSRHFAQLERTGLVSVRQEGGMKFYSANRQRIKEICQLLLKTFE
jgi:DNA-binding transcriptional ArsR family regulator